MSAPLASSHVLSLAPSMTSTVRSTASPPRPPSIHPPSPPTNPLATAASDQKNKDEDHPMASPPPPTKLPEVAVSSKDPAATSDSMQTPSQLALLLSNALTDVDTLKQALADEKKRAARAERLWQSFHPAENGVSDELKNDKMSQGALKAVLDAEARADRAERARDDALHALHSLTAHFAELERYESSLSLRAADARSAFSQLLTNITASHPPPASSPTLSGSPTALALPGLPPSLPAPSTLSGPGAPPPASSSTTRYTRNLPSYATASFGGYPSPSYAHGAAHARQSSHANSAPFSTLPLPPPPSASGLGSGFVGGSSAAPPSSSSSFSVPVKRSHKSRSARGLDGNAENVSWEESKRRRVGTWDMDVDETNASHADQPLPYPQHQQPLSAQPTQRGYDRDRVQHQQSYARSGASYPTRYDEPNGNGVASVNGLVRVDARELVRDAKERERRHYQTREGETSRRSRRGRSASRSSAGSSWSIDEMLLETATDGGRERDGRPSPGGPHLDSAQYPPHTYSRTATGLAPFPEESKGFADLVKSSHSSQASIGSTAGANGTGEKEKNGKVPATQLVTLGPGGVVVSGGGQAASIPGGGFPAQNASGQRICRQCGVPGRYKDGKCVEKWGPGPEGPGTVCDRCRKKMKRVERRGTLDSAAAAAQHQSFLSQRQSHAQLQAQPTLPLAPSSSPSYSRTRAPVYNDRLLETKSTILNLSPKSSQQHAYSHERGRSKEERNGDDSSRSHSPVPRYQPNIRHPQNQSQSHRRAPTPPYITSISTHEQDENGDGEDENVKDESGELDIDAEIAQAASVVTETKGRAAMHRSARDTGFPPRSSSRASSTSTATANERNSGSKKGVPVPSTVSSSKRVPLLASVVTPRAARRRDTQDELDEDDAEGDADADADADAEIMDAVDAAMKVEE